MNTIWEHVLCITMILSILPIMAVAEGNGVPYLDETGTLAETGENIQVTEINSENVTDEWSTGWYVVNYEVEISERITVTGEVHLILADSSKLTVPNGISVTSDNSLTIFGQSGVAAS